MKNDETNCPPQKQKNEGMKKPFLQRHKRAAITISLIVIVVSSIIPFIMEHKDDNYLKYNDSILLEATAKSLGKSVNEFTEADFSKVTKVSISGQELVNVSLLKKCVNL